MEMSMYKKQTRLTSSCTWHPCWFAWKTLPASSMDNMAAVARETTVEHLGTPGRLASGVELPWTKCRIHARVSAFLRSPWPWFAACDKAAQRRVVILGPMAVNPFQGSRWLLHAHADRPQVHGSKMRPIYFTTTGERSLL